MLFVIILIVPAARLSRIVFDFRFVASLAGIRNLGLVGVYLSVLQIPVMAEGRNLFSVGSITPLLGAVKCLLALPRAGGLFGDCSLVTGMRLCHNLSLQRSGMMQIKLLRIAGYGNAFHSRRRLSRQRRNC